MSTLRPDVSPSLPAHLGPNKGACSSTWTVRIPYSLVDAYRNLTWRRAHTTEPQPSCASQQTFPRRARQPKKPRHFLDNLCPLLSWSVWFGLLWLAGL
eukprot:5753483-Amphidinium_carterae.1